MVATLINFKYGSYYEVTYDGVTMRDLYKLILEYFSSFSHVFWYIFSMLALGVHLSHGIYSAFQSLGLYHSPCAQKCLKKISMTLGVLFCFGYCLLPLWAYFKGASL